MDYAGIVTLCFVLDLEAEAIAKLPDSGVVLSSTCHDLRERNPSTSRVEKQA